MPRPVSLHSDKAHRESLTLLGLPEQDHATYLALNDQIEAWCAENPGRDPLCSGECDHLFQAVGALFIRSGAADEFQGPPGRGLS